MKYPLVTCIMPTANRQHFIPYSIDYFLHQDYPNAELLILDDGITSIRDLIPNHIKIRYYYVDYQLNIGKKRNLCCENAKGEIIIHWDDDDWYAEDWISKQVNALITSEADITGLSEINYFSSLQKKKWKYRNSGIENNWVYGATLSYWKTFWEGHPFNDMNTGEDNDFVYNSGAKILIHNYTDGYLGIIHETNTGVSLYEDPREKLQLAKWAKSIEKPDKPSLKKQVIVKNPPLVSCIMPTANRRRFITSALKNFIEQDYPNKELIILDDGIESIKDLIPTNQRIHYFHSKAIFKIGEKRNQACKLANGELIMHFDDDDWYAPDWISHEVFALTNSDADIVGINQVQFFSPDQNKYWMIKNSNSKRPWLTGASLIYRKSFWENHPFKALSIGEDDDYVRNNGAKIFAHDYYQGFISTLHSSNTNQSTIKLLEE